MMKTHELSQLIDPVIFCAIADEVGPSSFVDRAARGVLRRLGKDVEEVLHGASQYCAAEPVASSALTRVASDRHSVLDGTKYAGAITTSSGISTRIPKDKRRIDKASLGRCQWIDKQVLRFFQCHPTGTGIEVNAGLSTRFHRLSDASDWPRFSWRTVNTEEVSGYVNLVFPVLDNHVSIVSDEPFEHWVDQLSIPNRSSSSNAKIALIDEPHRMLSEQNFRDMAALIRDHLGAVTPSLDLILVHRIANIDEIVARLGDSVSLVSSYPSKQKVNSPLHRCLKRLKSLFNFVSPPFADHLIFYTN